MFLFNHLPYKVQLSVSDVNLFGSRLEVKVFDKFGKKVDANVVEYGKWLDDFSRNYIMRTIS